MQLLHVESLEVFGNVDPIDMEAMVSDDIHATAKAVQIVARNLRLTAHLVFSALPPARPVQLGLDRLDFDQGDFSAAAFSPICDLRSYQIFKND